MFDLATALRGAVTETLTAAISRAPSASKAPADPDAILARLKLASELYDVGNPFEEGALITPRADANIKGAGEPCIVVEDLSYEPVLLRNPLANLDDASSQLFGRKLDLRYTRIVNGTVHSFLGESQDFEAWTPEHEAAWRAKLAEKEATPQPLSLPEIISALRDRAAGREVKAEWKDGDLVELVTISEKYEAPMDADGVRVGIVNRVDPTDGTTNVLYHAASTGKIGGAWFKNADLRRYGPRSAEGLTPSA